MAKSTIKEKKEVKQRVAKTDQKTETKKKTISTKKTSTKAASTKKPSPSKKKLVTKKSAKKAESKTVAKTAEKKPEKKVEKKVVKKAAKKIDKTKKVTAKTKKIAVKAVKEIPAEAEKVKSKTKKKSGPQPKTMEELMSMTGYEPVVPRKGEKIQGKIIEKTDKMLKLDISAKSYGVVAEQEFDFAQDYIADLKVGDSLDATVISAENNRGQILLSLKGAASDAKWEYFESALNDATGLEAKGVEVNKGGLIVVVNGVRGFVPSSQFSRRYLDRINDLKGDKFKVKAIEVDRERNRLIFSERHVSEEKQLSQRAEALSKVSDGNIYEGVISGVKSFGLFMTVEVPIDGSDLTDKVEDGEFKPEHRGKNELPSEKIGYVEGLIHISEISWEKVDHPKNYHQVGDRVLIKVMGVDEKSGKLNLSIKRLKQDPWNKVAKEYPVGTTFTGKVSRIEPFGVFVNVMPGVDGLIHSSKLSPETQFKEGSEVTVNVDSIEPEKRRMSLSMVLTEVPMGYR
jgi:predicted RNA-binding protein with RPS1 domain